MSDHIITVKVRAKARERSITRAPDGTYKIKTTVAPEKGKANADVVEMLAEHLRVPRSRIQLISGETSPTKRFKIIAQ